MSRKKNQEKDREWGREASLDWAQAILGGI